MNKNSLLDNKLLTKSNIALVLILTMIAGFLVSRAVLSMATLAFGLNALWNINPKKWFSNRWWLLGWLWILIYFASYFWSTDKDFWNHHSEIKTPILLFPLVFGFLPRFSNRQLVIFTLATGAMLVAGACYSSSFLIGKMSYYMEQYRIAHVLPTPAEGDYIRFSVFIALFVIWCFSFWGQLPAKGLKWIIGIIAGILILYLHVLASKSGLLTLYLFLFMWAAYLAISRKKILSGLGIAVIVIVFLKLALVYMPTLHQRAGYISYTLIAYNEGDQSGIYGDIGRLMSYDVAGRIINQNPVAGVGVGDMLNEMIAGYGKWYPKVAVENRLLPHNQFMIIALGCGIIAAFIFAIWVFYPLTWLRKNKESFYFFAVWLVLLIQLMIEPVLEVQYGVFVYLFFLLWQKHTLPEGKPARA